MNALTVTDLENFANGKPVSVQNFKNSNTNMEQLTPAEQNLIKANLQFTNFFLDSDLEGEQFTFTLSNASTASQTIVLFKGADSTISTTFIGSLGTVVPILDGQLKPTPSGSVDSGDLSLVTASSGTPNLTIANMMAYLASKNTEITKIRATFSDTLQVSQTLILKKINPLKNLRDDFFMFSDDRLKGVSDQNTFDITKSIYLTRDNALQYNLLPGSSSVPNRVTFTFFFGLQMKDSTMFGRVMELYKSAARRVAPAGVLNEVAADVTTLNNSPVTMLLN
ncbi:hypothetical protein [Emticicia sp. W12TSBA100-4]|uniref:hypothetical protein n=1 Tax=Emticicia sp. W12TSBA100-4 TaxID=3160965 RepID=UPI00330601D2